MFLNGHFVSMRARLIAVGKSGCDQVSWEAAVAIQAGADGWQFIRCFQMQCLTFIFVITLTCGVRMLKPEGGMSVVKRC